MHLPGGRVHQLLHPLPQLPGDHGPFETAFLAGLCSHADGAVLQFAGMALIWVSNTLTTADGNTGKANIAFCCICAAMTLAEMALFRGEMRRTKATKAR